jgi:hypothetical protein
LQIIFIDITYYFWFGMTANKNPSTVINKNTVP